MVKDLASSEGKNEPVAETHALSTSDQVNGDERTVEQTAYRNTGEAHEELLFGSTWDDAQFSALQQELDNIRPLVPALRASIPKRDVTRAAAAVKDKPDVDISRTPGCADASAFESDLEPDHKSDHKPENNGVTDRASVSRSGDARLDMNYLLFVLLLTLLFAGLLIWISIANNHHAPEINVAPVSAQPFRAVEQRVSTLEQKLDQLEGAMQTLQQQLTAMRDQPISGQQEGRVTKASPQAVPSHRVHRGSGEGSEVHGAWLVNAVSVDSLQAANRELASFKAIGIQGTIHTAIVNGKTWYRIQSGSYASQQEAQRQLNMLSRKLDITDAWVQQVK